MSVLRTYFVMEQSVFYRLCFVTAALALLACLCGTAQSAFVQHGQRFPQGIILGSEVNCTLEEHEGILRLHEDTVQVCRSSGWVNINSNETTALNTEIGELKQRVDTLESELSTCQSSNSSNPSSAAACSLGHLEGLTALQLCNRHGIYDFEARRCVCDCDSTLGCWQSGPNNFCESCAQGWTGDDCLGDIEPPVLTIIGQHVVTHEAGDPYVDAGATSHDNKDLDITSGIIVASTVVSDTVGNYTVEYYSTDNAGHLVVAIRAVHVVDTTPPVLTLTGDLVITLEAGADFVESGYSATDNAVGAIIVTNDLGSIDLQTVATFTLTYTAVDAAGNVGVPRTRTIVIVDTTPPVLTLVGPAEILHPKNVAYVDVGVATSDNSNGVVSVSSFSNVNVSAEGIYTVTYAGTDESGNEAVNVSRSIEIIAAQTCNDYAIAANGSVFENGVYPVGFGGAAKDSYCYFANGKGYDLLANLNTEDTAARVYADTDFWLSTATFGTMSPSVLSADYKGWAYTELDRLVEVLLVLYDNTDNHTVAEAVYRVRCSYSGESATFHSAMNAGSNVQFTGTKRSASVSLGLSHGASFDQFFEHPEALLLNRDAAYSSTKNLNRVATTKTSAPQSGHIFGGIGGDHFHSQSGGWGIEYEVHPTEPYCNINDGYGDPARSFQGNYKSSYTNWPWQSSGPNGNCVPSGAVWHPWSLAIYALSVQSVVTPPVSSISSCDMYLSINPSATSGPILLPNGRSSYCHFVDGKGYDLLFNVDTGDNVVRHYHDTGFWYGSVTTGDTATALSTEFVGDAFRELSDYNEIMVMVHDAGSPVYSGFYNTVCGSTSTMANYFATESAYTLTGYKITTNGAVGFGRGNVYDEFIEGQYPIVLNRQSAFSATTNLNRVATATTLFTGSGHAFGGVGGDHYHSQSGGWGFYYEYEASETYCNFDSLYGTVSGNIACQKPSYPNCPLHTSNPQGNCSPSSYETRAYDFAMFARKPTGTEGCTDC